MRTSTDPTAVAYQLVADAYRAALDVPNLPAIEAQTLRATLRAADEIASEGADSMDVPEHLRSDLVALVVSELGLAADILRQDVDQPGEEEAVARMEEVIAVWHDIASCPEGMWPRCSVKAVAQWARDNEAAKVADIGLTIDETAGVVARAREFEALRAAAGTVS